MDVQHCLILSKKIMKITWKTYSHVQNSTLLNIQNVQNSMIFLNYRSSTITEHNVLVACFDVRPLFTKDPVPNTFVTIQDLPN